MKTRLARIFLSKNDPVYFYCEKFQICNYYFEVPYICVTYYVIGCSIDDSGSGLWSRRIWRRLRIWRGLRRVRRVRRLRVPEPYHRQLHAPRLLRLHFHFRPPILCWQATNLGLFLQSGNHSSHKRFIYYIIYVQSSLPSKTILKMKSSWLPKKVKIVLLDKLIYM